MVPCVLKLKIQKAFYYLMWLLAMWSTHRNDVGVRRGPVDCTFVRLLKKTLLIINVFSFPKLEAEATL